MTEKTADRWITMVAGIRRRTLAAGEHMMQMLVTLDAGSHLPEHQHPHEQLTHVLRGRLRFSIAGAPTRSVWANRSASLAARHTPPTHWRTRWSSIPSARRARICWPRTS